MGSKIIEFLYLPDLNIEVYSSKSIILSSYVPEIIKLLKNLKQVNEVVIRLKLYITSGCNYGLFSYVSKN